MVSRFNSECCLSFNPTKDPKPRIINVIKMVKYPWNLPKSNMNACPNCPVLNQYHNIEVIVVIGAKYKVYFIP